MASVEDLEKVFRGYPGVECRGLELPVTEELLDVANVGAVAEKVGGERVAQQVRMDSRDRDRGGVLPHEDREGHLGEAPGSFSISCRRS